MGYVNVNFISKGEVPVIARNSRSPLGAFQLKC